VPVGIDSINNLYDLGSRKVSLANVSFSSGGYSTEDYHYYVDYTISTCNQSQSVISLLENTPYAITVETGYNPETVVVWIDFNNDGIFDPYTERVMKSIGQMNWETHTQTFTVPATGVTYCTPLRMRVASDFAIFDPEPCSNPVYGQTEDYIVIINKILNPSITITASTTSFCLGTSVSFTATAMDAEYKPHLSMEKEWPECRHKCYNLFGQQLCKW